VISFLKYLLFVSVKHKSFQVPLPVYQRSILYLQGDNVSTASEVLQDLDLALDLLLLDRLQSFDYALLVVRDVDGLEDLAERGQIEVKKNISRRGLKNSE